MESQPALVRAMVLSVMLRGNTSGTAIDPVDAVRGVVERPAVKDPTRNSPSEFVALAKNPKEIANASVRQKMKTGS